MTARDRILLISLWLSVVALTTWVGGTLYQMLVIVPLWSASPPESVRAFFQGTEWNRTILNFFGPPFIAVRNVPIVTALIAGWHLPQHRRALLIATGCFTVFGAIFTIAYVYPINAVLFERAGGSQSADEIRALVDEWIFRDRVRFLVGLIPEATSIGVPVTLHTLGSDGAFGRQFKWPQGLVGLVAVLYAFRLPIPGERNTQNSTTG